MGILGYWRRSTQNCASSACTPAIARLTSTLTPENTRRRKEPVALLRWLSCQREAQQVCSSTAKKKHPLCNS
uniref:Uncharacterized protein n=1 Tax=Arundo donax TaxID=35708 RepID=A0A0A9GUC7_ARUDO